MKLDLLFLNDVHGYLEPHPELFYNNTSQYIQTAGGYAQLATVIERVRKENPHTLLFDGGDTFHGTLPLVDTKGEIVVPVLNKLGIDAMVGHWDFGYGPSHLTHIMQQLSYPLLAINVYNQEGGTYHEREEQTFNLV